MISVATLPQDLVLFWELQVQGLMVGWGPCKCVFNKFPGAAAGTGLGTNESEHRLMLVHKDATSNLYLLAYF